MICPRHSDRHDKRMTSIGQRSSGNRGTRTPSRPPDERIALPAIIGIESWGASASRHAGDHGVLPLQGDHRRRHRPTTTATALMGAYGSVVYLCTIAGGWIGDRILGAERPCWPERGSPSPATSLCWCPARAGVAIGMVRGRRLGRLRPPRSHARPGPRLRRPPRQQQYFFGINVGGLLGPAHRRIVVAYGFDVGFAAAILMIAGLIHYWHRRRLSGSWRNDARVAVESRPRRSDGVAHSWSCWAWRAPPRRWSG